LSCSLLPGFQPPGGAYLDFIIYTLAYSVKGFFKSFLIIFNILSIKKSHPSGWLKPLQYQHFDPLKIAD